MRFTRDVANITMDLNSVEHINFTALGGADNITVGDLTGTGVTQVALDLSATPGSGNRRRRGRHVTVTGTGGNDQIQVIGCRHFRDGQPAWRRRSAITGAEGANDVLTISAGNGNDTIDAAYLAGRIIEPRHRWRCRQRHHHRQPRRRHPDRRRRQRHGDRRPGNDAADLGDGNDTFIWNPGDGSDIVEGGAGTDTLVFNGANVAENIDISANGGRARLTRDVGNVTMDLNGVEHIQLNALGGADTITVNDLTGTGVTQVAIDLGATPGGRR